MPLQKITSTDITSVSNTIISGTITGSQISANTISNTAFQTGSVENYMSAQGTPFGNRNRIINGRFDIWQRGTSFTNTANSYQFTADRWYVFSGIGIPATSGQISTGRQDFPYALRVQRPATNTSTNNTVAGQVLESINCRDLAGQTVTISFYARAGSNYSTASNALGIWVATGTGTDQGVSNVINNAWTSQAYIQNSVTLTTSFIKYTVSVSIPAGTNEIAMFFITFPTGTAGANDYFDVTGVQLEVGSVATPFEHRQYGTEKLLCERYAQLYYPCQQEWIYVESGSTTMNRWWQTILPVAMRTSPSVSYRGTWTGGNAGPAGTITNIALEGSTLNRLSHRVTSSSTTATSYSTCHTDIWQTNSCYLLITAEL